MCGKKVDWRKINFHILHQALLCQHQQTACPLLVVTVRLPLWTNTGFEGDAVFLINGHWLYSGKVVCLSWPQLLFRFLSESFPPIFPLFVSFFSLHLFGSSGSARHNCVSWEIISSWPCSRTSDIFHLFIDFSTLCHFFYRPPPPFRCHFSSSPQNHFHLSSHTNILTEFLLVREKEWKKQESKGMVQDCIFHQSELWENVHKQIEKYRYARGVKMSKEVEGKINILMCMHVCAHTHTHTHIHNKVCF